MRGSGSARSFPGTPPGARGLLGTGTRSAISRVVREGSTPIHTIPYHTIPYHTIPYHTIPYHIIPYHTIITSPAAQPLFEPGAGSSITPRAQAPASPPPRSLPARPALPRPAPPCRASIPQPSRPHPQPPHLIVLFVHPHPDLVRKEVSGVVRLAVLRHHMHRRARPRAAADHGHLLRRGAWRRRARAGEGGQQGRGVIAEA
jgi:hypothetical protein